LAQRAGIIVAFETGQETAALLRRTLDDLKAPNVKVNFDPANMLLYDMDDPLKAVELLAPDIRSVHVKDAKRPRLKGTWGDEVPLFNRHHKRESNLCEAPPRAGRVKFWWPRRPFGCRSPSGRVRAR